MRITVFLGSKDGVGPGYLAAARDFGTAIARAGAGLVYGGAGIGLMSAVADAALEAGGEVIGVMPQGLVRREGLRTDLTAMHVVETIHERKALMAELGDAFVSLPGGLGTMEELFEIWTWAQLGFHAKPVALLNVQGFFDPLTAFIEHAARQGFLTEADRGLIHVDDDPARLLEWVLTEAERRRDLPEDLSRI